MECAESGYTAVYETPANIGPGGLVYFLAVFFFLYQWDGFCGLAELADTVRLRRQSP